MTETAKTPVRCGLSGTALKYIACITMLIDHIGASCIEAGILLPALAAGAASCGGIPVSTLLAADRVLRYIGRLAFPIFCFLAVEGFLHTHDVKKYVRRLLLFGLLSEAPFDLAFFRTPFAPQHQNVYWTLALGVLAMAGLKRFEKENGLPGWQGLVWAGGCAALALAANTDYHAIGVLIICTLYLTRADRKRQCLAGALLFLFVAHRAAGLCAGLVLQRAARRVQSAAEKSLLLVLPGAPAGASRYHEPYAITAESPPSKDSGLFTASHIGNIAPVSSSMAGTVTSIHTVEWATA